jgi:TonB family protein
MPPSRSTCASSTQMFIPCFTVRGRDGGRSARDLTGATDRFKFDSGETVKERKMRSALLLVKRLVFFCLLVSFPGVFALAQEWDDPTRLILEARGMARMERYQEALDALNKSKRLAEISGDQLTVVIALRNIAEIYRLQGDEPEASSYARQAAEIYNEITRGPEPRTDDRLVPEDRPSINRSGGISASERESRIREAIERVRNRLQTRQQERDVLEIAKDPAYGNYLEGVKEAIVQAWMHPKEPIEVKKEEGSVGIHFTILQDGQIENLRILHPSQRLSMNLEAMRAVKTAAPFAPIPETLGLKRIHIQFTFNYTLNETY